MTKAIGMIETRGFIGSVEAADAMVKAADVSLFRQEKIDGALVTVLVEGDVSAVQAAVERGKEAAALVGELVGAHVIPNPDQETRQILFIEEEKPKTKPRRRKTASKEAEGADKNPSS